MIIEIDHLEGKDIVVLIDETMGSVSDGQITIDIDEIIQNEDT